MIKQFFIFLLLNVCLFSSAKPVIDLGRYENKIYSQNGEDGVLLKIFDAIGTQSNYFVEFGVQNGIECNTRYLREHYLWEGLMMDAGYSIPNINLRQEWINAKNINALFDKYHVPDEFDLLSIDIDFNDFYVWKAIEPRFSPRVVVIEYNATHLAHEDKIVKYQPNGGWDGSNYYGASILALYRLGREKGYPLVYAENRGVNLFFIRDDVLAECPFEFKDVNEVELLYKKPNYSWGPNGGHPMDPYGRIYISSFEVE